MLSKYSAIFATVLLAASTFAAPIDAASLEARIPRPPSWKRGSPDWRRGSPDWRRGSPDWRRGGTQPDW
ncbi:hypothetical protein PLEOSDRAFT_1070124 [Pleurotus ostreatus PC15]|uniref:Uncharacterized protein n=1 Tax=Pleurotus ostreatus (strain PC15) TaxID=1137138 RepID=A0A067P3J9_PLEO1|nr:hypothetical protein PLEOSDRAFT_1070124 [Pleurotus ostreatus PC15]